MAARLLTASNGKLAKVNLTTILKHPKAWDSLTSDQQEELCALLPPNPAGQGPTSRHPLKTELAPYIKHAIVEHESDLREGRLTQTWTNQAKEASGARQAAKYDDVKESEREEYWGQKSALIAPVNQKSSETSTVPSTAGVDKEVTRSSEQTPESSRKRKLDAIDATSSSPLCVAGSTIEAATDDATTNTNDDSEHSTKRDTSEEAPKKKLRKRSTSVASIGRGRKKLALDVELKKRAKSHPRI